MQKFKKLITTPKNLSIVVAITIFMLSVGYSAFSSKLFVDNMIANVAVLPDMRVTGIKNVETKTICTLVDDADGSGTTSIGDEFSCDPGDGVSRTFYLLEKTETELLLLMDRNIDNTTMAWCDPNGPYPLDNACQADGAKAALASKTSGWVNVDVSMPTREQIYSITSSNSLSSAPWLYANLDNDSSTATKRFYWTGTASSSNSTDAIYVNSDGSMGSFHVKYAGDLGVRPVIGVNSANIDLTLLRDREVTVFNDVCSIMSDADNSGSVTVGDKYSCDPGDGTSRTFYVLEKKDDSVSLILDRNIDNTTMRWCVSEPCDNNGANGALKSKTSGWNRVWVSMPTYDQIYNVNGSRTLTESPWLYGNLDIDSSTAIARNYWTSSFSTVDPSSVIYVSYAGTFGSTNYMNAYESGVRPVITMPTTTSSLSNYAEHENDNISMGIVLPYEDSTITYDVTLTNLGNVEMGIFDITGLPDNLEYSILGYDLKDKICDSSNKCKLGANETISITIKYKEGGYDYSNITHNVMLDFEFQPFYSVTYTNIENKGYPTEVITNDTLVVDFGSNIVPAIRVKIDGVEISNYTYENGILTVPNVTSNIEVIKRETIYVANSPDLANNSLVPVIYDGTDWVVADTTKEWYNYDNQEWANAVVLKDGLTKNVGDTLTVDGSDPDVTAMFVWIPRYEYKYTNLGTQYAGGTKDAPGGIEINFIPKDIIKGGDGYKVHPAFTFGNNEVSGIWVGKFETSHTTLESVDNTLNCVDENCENASGLRILPNVVSIRDQSLSNLFFAGRSIGDKINLDTSSVDSHMMKSSEWGAVAYLSQSKYGKYGNTMYTGADKAVYINKSTEYITGISSGTASVRDGETLCMYNDLTDRGNGIGSCGGGASTTGNITGIYDMSGGSHEFVTGYNVTRKLTGNNWGESISTSTGNVLNYSTFTQAPDAKYYDAYTTTSKSTEDDGPVYCNGEECYGHALLETADWYNNSSSYVTIYNAWFVRGGGTQWGTTTNSGPGIFATGNNQGYPHPSITFRVTLTPQN